MILAAALLCAMNPSTTVTIVDRPLTGTNSAYVGNRAPLKPSAFRKLPVGAIRPEGWVRKQLELQADGFIGHLPEISRWLKKENNAWLSLEGAGEHGWEEVPYWLKGFGDTGYILGDERIKAEAKIWIEGVLGSQREDGYFGPRANLVSNNGKPDVWPNMVMLNALQTYHEHTGDPRVLAFMTRYFRWQLNLPKESLLLSYWELHRGGDNLESVYWLYNRTGDVWLLDLARKLHERSANWGGPEVPDWHGVNIAQAFREPTQWGMMSQYPEDLAAAERNYKALRKDYGQVPGGLYGADENARPGFYDPRQAAETCAMAEMMLSDYLLIGHTGDPVWAERCEDVAFNSLPASMTSDLKALHYLTSPNMILCDAASKSPGIQNGGPMFLFDPNDHRCCQHNVSHGWPYYAEHLWFATAKNGLGVVLYAPSTVTAKVGDGTEVTIREETRYPFEERVTFRLSTPKPVSFPLTLRLPSWCEAPGLVLNGKRLALTDRGGYVVIEREWQDGDVLRLDLPMAVTTTRWDKNQDSVSVHRGPLTYSLKIGERRVRKGGTDAWPAWEIRPTTAWNYGLESTTEFEVVTKRWPKSDQPFAAGAAPIELRAKARRIPEWQMDSLGLVGVLQPSPARTREPVETVTLVPMGSARLRIASFPTVSPARTANAWKAPQRARPGLPATASHVNDRLEALTDGVEPRSSEDLMVPRFTWWDHKGTEEWVEIALPKAKQVSVARVYWFDDRNSKGLCRPPAEWRLEAWLDGGWFPVAANGPYGVELHKYNEVAFTPVVARRFRIVAQLQPEVSAGILEWELK